MLTQKLATTCISDCSTLSVRFSQQGVGNRGIYILNVISPTINLLATTRQERLEIYYASIPTGFSGTLYEDNKPVLSKEVKQLLKSHGFGLSNEIDLFNTLLRTLMTYYFNNSLYAMDISKNGDGVVVAITNIYGNVVRFNIAVLAELQGTGTHIRQGTVLPNGRTLFQTIQSNEHFEQYLNTILKQ